MGWFFCLWHACLSYGDQCYLEPCAMSPIAACEGIILQNSAYEIFRIVQWSRVVSYCCAVSLAHWHGEGGCVCMVVMGWKNSHGSCPNEVWTHLVNLWYISLNNRSSRVLSSPGSDSLSYLDPLLHLTNLYIHAPCAPWSLTCVNEKILKQTLDGIKLIIQCWK